MTQTGPTIKRGQSSGDIWTPQSFRAAVAEKFGPIAVDLAATAQSSLAPVWIDEQRNSLTQGWWMLEGLLWLNPPYSNITPWAKKCAEESLAGANILLLVPMGGQNWYWDYVEPYADVYSVGRMVFDNCFDKNGDPVTTAYPKDLILAHYYADTNERPKMQRWRWKL